METIEINGTIYEVGRVKHTGAQRSCYLCCISEDCFASDKMLCRGFDKGEFVRCAIGKLKPTKDQLIKAFQIFYSDKIDAEYVDAESDFEPIVSQILEHWEDECKKTES